MKPHELLVFDFEHGAPAYTTPEVCVVCEVSPEQIQGFVECGLLRPEGTGPESWRFPPHAIVVVRRALQLQRELELEMPGLLLAMELLEEIGALRRQVERLRSQLACFTPEV
jgi:chaperone modulatory protein CbpM